MATRKVYRSYRSKLRLAPGDENYLVRLCGIYRWVYSLGVIRQERILRLSQSVEDLMELDSLRRLYARESAMPGREWLREAPADVAEHALRNLHRGYGLYLTQRRDGLKGYERHRPQLRRRHHSKASFTLSRLRKLETLDARGRRRLALVSGDGHRYEFFELNLLPERYDHIVRAVVRRVHGDWHMTVQLCETIEVEAPGGSRVGVDMGFHQTAATSEGELYQSRDLPEGQRRRLRSLRATLATQTPGSGNHRRTEAKIEKLLGRRQRIQDDQHHQISAAILRRNLPAEVRPTEVVLDHMNFTQMASEGHLDSVRRERLYQLYLKLRTKADWQGTGFVDAYKWYPSSKHCNACGFKVERMPLDVRTFDCPRCAYTEDRDINAALNLRDYREDDWQQVVASKNDTYLDSLPSIEAEEPSWDQMIEGEYRDHEIRETAREHGNESNNAPTGQGNDEDWEAIVSLREMRRQQ